MFSRAWNIFFAVFFLASLATCGKNDPAPAPGDGDPQSGPEPTPTATPLATPTPTPTPTATNYLYVASGAAYAGLGVTTSTPINTVAKYKLDGTFVDIIADYTLFPGDTPVALIDYDPDFLLVAIENATTAGRRVDKIAKNGSGWLTFISNAAAFGGAGSAIRDLLRTPDGGFLISKGSASPNAALEKFSNTKVRILMGANPYITNPAGTCATAQTAFPKVANGPSDTIVLVHSAASPNNKILLIKGTGYSVASDCITGIASPSANHIPTAVLTHSSGKLFVAFGNNSGPVHEIHSYTISASAISSPALIYKNLGVLQGISAMTEAPDGSLFITAASSTFNTVERFTYDSNTNLLSRVGSTPAILPNIYTRSVSALVTSKE